jgi:ubiquinone/menaquinone biosynthesis C-methylase UbiE
MESRDRYSQDWNEYSTIWDGHFRAQYAHLGDEWNDDGSPERKRDRFYFRAYIERWLRPEMTVLEIGPGGGKWTVLMAPLAKRVIVLDVAEAMLERTRARCEGLGLTNVEYVLANGEDFQPVPGGSIDFFFSYDVFVHIALEDTWPYTQEIARVLVDGGRGACHYAIGSPPEAWDRIERANEWYRFGRHTLGQFYYFDPQMLRRMYERCGLITREQHLENWSCTCVFEKPGNSIAPQLEALLRGLIAPTADDPDRRREIVAELRALPAVLGQRLAPLLEEVQNDADPRRRYDVAARIRRLWRAV